MSTGGSLEVSEFSCRHGRLTVVRGVQFAISRGERLAIVGSNGSGKSSLVEGMLGRIASTGRLLLDGQDISSASTARRVKLGLGLVPTGRGLFPRLTVKDNLLLGARVAPKEERATAIARSLEMFPALKSRMAEHAGLLSGGQQQMLAIARALACNPSVLILDEPTQGLAPTMRDEIASSLRQISAEGMSLIVAEQNLPFAAQVADTYLLLSGGRVVKDGPAVDLLDSSEAFKLMVDG